MTTPPSFPTLAGQGWSVHKRPTWSTRVASHTSGREVRAALYKYPLYEFEVTFDGLDSSGAWTGLGASSLQTLLGFFQQMQGQLSTFLYVDPTDHSVSGAAVGRGDGTTASFALGRTIGGFNEPVGWVTAISAVYFNGVAQPSGNYSLVAPNVLDLAPAPGSGVVVTADFSYAFVCRFLADQTDFENVMSGLWQVKSLKFRSTKVNG